MVVTCPQCGTDLPPQARFCIHCGAPVEAAQPERAASPAPEPTVSERIAGRLRRLVPQEYVDRLLATRGQAISERRLVTVLFSDVKGSTAMAEHLDPEEVLEIMGGAFEVLIEPVYRHEGTLARLMGDAVLAFFGAPLAHEDDPERAVRAALEIVAGARRYARQLERERDLPGFNVRVGINTGLVVTGEVGTDLRVEYTAMGDAVNLAARMEQGAPPGGILITDHVYRHVRGVFDVQAQPLLTVKGKAEPVQTYLVQGARPRAFRKPMRGVEGVETRLVGREAELEHLQEAFRTVIEDGEFQMVTVAGSAGVGKSRLLYEFNIWAELLPERFSCFEGRADQGMQNLPYGLLRDLVSHRFQILDSDAAEVMRAKLEGGLAQALGSGEKSRQSAHLVGHLLGFALGHSPYLAGAPDDPKQLRDQALVALADYFRGLAAQAPVLILLEDLHWADESYLDALNHLAQALATEPVMVACTTRPALFERRPHWGEGQLFHARLPLEPLSRWDSRQLAAEILQKVPEVPQALRDLLVTGAEGNPFFLEELVRMLVEDGVIVTGEERWRLEPGRLAEIRVPPTLTGVLQARVDRLPVEERTVLQQASVVGRLFWDRAVARIHASPGQGMEANAATQEEIAGRLATLRGREMIYQRETSAFAEAQEYIFQHALLREVAYQSVLKRLRRVYHGLVADWLLEQSGERAGEYTTLIADHLTLAGRTEEAVEALLEVGDRARGLYAHPEAIRAYERALALLKEMGDDERAARTLMALGLAHHTAFDFQRAREAYDEGFVLWQRSAQAVRPSRAPRQTLRLSHAEPTGLDPALAYDTFAVPVLDQLFSGLVELTPEPDIVPDIARAWEILDGGRRYIFHLRDDSRWSDGAPVVAEDFCLAWQRVLDPEVGSPAASLLYAIKGAGAFHLGEVSDPVSVAVRAPNPTTLVVELEEPTAYFLHALASSPACPVPCHVVARHGAGWTAETNLVTNGPFRLEGWERGELLVLSQNPDWHGSPTGNVSRVELSFWREPSAELQRYEADELHILDMQFFGPVERDVARALYTRECVTIPQPFTSYVGFVASQPPFNDPRVRRAFVLATDREALANIVMRGFASPALGGFVPPGMPGHSSRIGLAYDPGQARQLLSEAGYPDGQGFPLVDFMVHTDPASAVVAPILQSQWQENLGLTVHWKAVEWADYLDRINRRPPHLFLWGWVADYPDPDSFLSTCPFRDQTRWQNEAYNGLIEGASQVLDQQERLSLYKRADGILIGEAAILPLVYYRSHLLVKPTVVRLPLSPMAYWFWKDVVIESQ